MQALRGWLMVVLVLILPVQGLAAAFAPLHQAANHLSEAAGPCHGHQADAAQSEHPSNHDGTTSHSTDGDVAGHLCCHQVFSGAPATEIRTATQKISDVPQTAPLLHSLFVPESPYRPPRG